MRYIEVIQNITQQLYLPSCHLCAECGSSKDKEQPWPPKHI